MECSAGDAPAGHTLTFHHICYDVVVRGPDGPSKRILHGLSAGFESGRLTAVMGPSGAGKSSLLDILAGVKVAGSVSGRVLVDGLPRGRGTAALGSSYVQQRDVLVPSATVREALVTSALLKLPREMSRAEKLARVDHLLSLLELTHVKHSLIGDEALGIKGISGGEKRRVSVGVEVVKDPAVIFLDEPTTGLDSEMALGVTASLKTMARAGKMVVATIHAPSCAITDHFDDWVLLARGRLLYAGPWGGALPYFEAAGYACPRYTSPADFFISLASNAATVAALEAVRAKTHLAPAELAGGKCAAAARGGNVAMQADARRPRGAEQGAAAAAAADVELGAVGAPGGAQRSALQPSRGHQLLLPPAPPAAGKPVLVLTAASSSSSSSGSLSLASSSSSSSGSSGDASAGGAAAAPPGAGFWTSVLVLMARFGRSWLRTPIMAAAEVGQYVLLSLFIGLLYLRSPAVLPDGPLDRLGAVFMVLATLAFIPSYTVLVVWDHERALLRRETASNTYSRAAFFVAKTLTTTPIEVAQASLFAAVTYFLIGFQVSGPKFAVYLVTLVAFALTSETLGYMAAIATPDSKVGVAALSVVLLLLLSFSGYLVRNIPAYFAWVTRVSYFSYATYVLVANEFEGLEFAAPAGSGGGAVPGEALVPAGMSNGLGLGANLGVLLGMMVGCRAACLLLLELAAHWRFL